MNQRRVIADEDTAWKIGTAAIAGEPHSLRRTMGIFSYPDKRSGLTLFGVEIVTLDANGNRQTETIVTQ